MYTESVYIVYNFSVLTDKFFHIHLNVGRHMIINQHKSCKQIHLPVISSITGTLCKGNGEQRELNVFDHHKVLLWPTNLKWQKHCTLTVHASVTSAILWAHHKFLCHNLGQEKRHCYAMNCTESCFVSKVRLKLLISMYFELFYLKIDICQQERMEAWLLGHWWINVSFQNRN